MTNRRRRACMNVAANTFTPTSHTTDTPSPSTLTPPRRHAANSNADHNRIMSAAAALTQQHSSCFSSSTIATRTTKHHSLLCSKGPCMQQRTQQQRQINMVAAPAAAARARNVRAQASASNNSHAGHAVLHDFCMTLPYGALAAVAGALAFAFKAPAVGLQLAAVAAVVAACSVLSLKAWKGGGSSTPYTLVSAGASGWVAFQMWQRVVAGFAPVPSGVVLAVSAALCLFCLYNVVAGGNPPPAKKAT